MIEFTTPPCFHYRLLTRLPRSSNILGLKKRRQVRQYSSATRNGLTPDSTLSHWTNDIKAIDLDYVSNIPPNGNETDGALVILHGLFGSKRNFGSLSKAFMRDLGRPIYALDLRNHGTSPHATPMDYKSMAADVRQFLAKKKLTGVSLLGHSMGGKVAMTLALCSSVPSLSNLIVTDIAPIRAALAPSFINYIEVMTRIQDPASRVRTREEADKVLRTVENDATIRQFLLTNLILPLPSASPWETVKFKVPLSILRDAIPALGSFPYSPDERTSWDGKTLFVRGAKSRYIKDANIPILRTFFPDTRLEVLDTGHWVHAEMPTEFRKLVANFINGSTTSAGNFVT